MVSRQWKRAPRGVGREVVAPRAGRNRSGMIRTSIGYTTIIVYTLTLTTPSHNPVVSLRQLGWAPPKGATEGRHRKGLAPVFFLGRDVTYSVTPFLLRTVFLFRWRRWRSGFRSYGKPRSCATGAPPKRDPSVAQGLSVAQRGGIKYSHVQLMDCFGGGGGMCAPPKRVGAPPKRVGAPPKQAPFGGAPGPAGWLGYTSLSRSSRSACTIAARSVGSISSGSGGWIPGGAGSLVVGCGIGL